MKIAFVYDAIYPWIKGGAEKRVYELAKRLVQRGHEVHWYGIGWWWTEDKQEDIIYDGIYLHGVCKPMALYKDERRSIKEAIYFALKLFPKLMKKNFDIVECQGFPFFSCFTAKIHSLSGKSKLIITLHEVWNDYWYEYLGKMGIFGKIIEKSVINLTDKIIVVSPKTRRDLRKIKKSENSIIIPNGIDCKRISKIKPSKENSDIIFAGRLIKEKNVDVLIKAVYLIKKQIPDIKCFIIGNGPEKAKLEMLVNKLDIRDNIIFKGFMDSYDDLIAYMKSSKVFVLPSIREGFGIVVIEANACGLPVIVVDHKMNAATDLIINNENGIISKLSENDIKDMIIEMIYKKEEMENNCIEAAKNYDWDKIVEFLEDYYFQFDI
ncbi:glycosyltransferase family 4 protein [Methanobacterium oryzae]|uniref:glycosyltransferase family 4 protein n=1 Tax=Methanobacterium oryzae TaxID=69540 RepID=UPI003D22292F